MFFLIEVALCVILLPVAAVVAWELFIGTLHLLFDSPVKKGRCRS